MYQELSPSGKDNFVLKSFYGLKIEDLGPGSGTDRGQTMMAGVSYRVVGTNLYSFNSVGVHTSIGIIDGGERCTFANDGVNLVINNGTQSFTYNGSTLTENTDTNIQNSKSVTYLNSFFIYTKEQTSVVSVAGDPTTSQGAISAESNGDPLVRDYTFDQTVFRFGDETVETMWNSNTGTPPFTRIEGQTFAVGCSAKHSINNTLKFIYWLGSDRRIYRARGNQEEVVSSVALSNAIESYDTVAQAFSEVFSFQNKEYYMITFPSDNKTWLLNEEFGENGWTEISSDLDGGKYQANSIQYNYGKLWAGDETSGRLFTLDKDTFTNGGDVTQRRRVLGSFNAKKLGMAQGKRLQVQRLELIMEQGVGLSEGQGENPRIMVEYSFDGGRTWPNVSWARVGRLGEYALKVEVWGIFTAYDFIPRLTITDPVPISIYSGVIDVREAGW
jgi:hypothetical protein